ncbi:MAG TPA: hypothetical protein VKV32_02325 [Stellaceae bacterium]|nr:hypothetical protein [Stellaceae bacterium]
MSTDKSPKRGQTKRRTRSESEAGIDQQIDDSFPASDPPSYAGGGRVGQPRRQKDEHKAREKAATGHDK